MKRISIFLLLIFVGIGLNSSASYAAKRKKKIIYKKHTQVDFSGEAIQGKIRAPEVFYIFQRKRTDDHQIDILPDHLGHHGEPIREAMEEHLK